VARFPGVHRFIENKYYVDELYQATVIGGTLALCRVAFWFDRHIVDGLVNGTRHVTVYLLGWGSNLFDKFVIDGAVNGVANGARASSGLIRRAQSGMVQNYLFVMGSGVVLMVVVYLVIKG